MNKPIKICKSLECDSCELPDKIKCHFKISDLLIFYLFSLPSFIYGGYILAAINLYIIMDILDSISYKINSYIT